MKLLGERRDVQQLLRGTDVLAQANTEPEPFGIIFAEALRAAVPVVTSNMGGAPEIVDASCGRLVEPGNSAALVSALRTVISDRTLRETLAAAGPPRAAAVCDPTRVLIQIREAVSSVDVLNAA